MTRRHMFDTPAPPASISGDASIDINGGVIRYTVGLTTSSVSDGSAAGGAGGGGGDQDVTDVSDPESTSRRSGVLLVVDDEESTCRMLATLLGAAGFEVVWETSAAAAIERLRARSYDVVLTDLNMGEIDGVAFSRIAQEIQVGMPVIVITGSTELDAAVGAMGAGAYDFVAKPIHAKLIVQQVQRAVGAHELRNRVVRLERELARVTGGGKLIGQSRAMRAVLELVARVADSDASVLVTGESGTGKELVARAIHDASGRASRPFVTINCAVVPATLIESELFGQVKSAFTDARRDRAGVFVQADGGTLFLDEIGELPLEMQPKLLRALQERRVRPVGGDADVAFDVRIVTATNGDLEAEVAAGRFREDLLYRIDVVRAELPPLRQRGHDVLLLAQHFLEKHASAGRRVSRISEPAAEKLLAYEWPGNVRELENSIARAVALSRVDTIGVDDLPRKIVEHRSNRVVVDVTSEDELISLEELESRYVRKVLAMVGGNKTRAAQVLGIDRRSLYRRLEKGS